MVRPRLRALGSRELEDLRWLAETIAVVLVTWLLLGTRLDVPITRGDGAVLVMPYVQSALRAGTDWSDHLYRFGLLGGSKMHEFGGTMPLVQMCAALGLSVTATVNAITWFIQIGIGFLGLKAVTALVTQWSSSDRKLSAPERITAVAVISFSPLVAWRLAYGHENLLLGLMPVVAALSLLWCARAKQISVTALLVGAFATANGISGLGAQTVIYSVAFAAPFALLVVLDAPRGARWGVREWSITAALLAGVLLVLPRLSVMIAHAAGPDASRALSEPVTYSFGEGRWIDWLTSIPWTPYFARTLGGATSIHEHNYPVGPLLLFVLVLWPKHASRRWLLGLAAGALLAILFANNVRPVSTVLLAVIPGLEAFRVPARAVLPLLVFVPILSVAALFAWPSDRVESTRMRWLGIAVGALVVAVGAALPASVRELAAWLGCAAIVIVARRRSDALVRWPLPIIAALGVVSFQARFPAAVVDPIESGPHAMRAALAARSVELRSELDRVVIVDPGPPYAMSTAWAAELPSIDGVWYPPRRFLELLGALDGTPLSPTTCVFQLARNRSFPLLAQLYNVRYALGFSGQRPTMMKAPSTPGAAWFPSRIEAIDEPSAMATALRTADPAAAIRTTAWLLRRDHAPVDVPAACGQAQVVGVTTDARGQVASFDVDTQATCPLVVAANYVSTFRAHTGTERLDVFPIDIALTAIVVPPGRSHITLEPVVSIPAWAMLGQLAGLVVAAVALVLLLRQPIE